MIVKYRMLPTLQCIRLFAVTATISHRKCTFAAKKNCSKLATNFEPRYRIKVKL